RPRPRRGSRPARSAPARGHRPTSARTGARSSRTAPGSGEPASASGPTAAAAPAASSAGRSWHELYPATPMAVRQPDTISRERASELVRAWAGGRPGPLGSVLGRQTAVDQVGIELRVESLKRRSIKKASKLWALDLAIRMMDLTTLEGRDTPG